MVKFTAPFHVALIILLPALAYAGVRHHQFVWDTIPFVLENPWIFDLTTANLISIFTEAHRANWHPFVLLSHAFDFAAFGNDPGAHHLMNVMHHIINSLLVYYLTRLLLIRAGREALSAWVACLTALIFALHPQHVESVAWVVERKDVLYALFTLACLITYVQASGVVVSPLKHALPFLLFCCAILSKPMAVTIPAILVLLDIFPLRNINTFKELVLSCGRKAPYWFVTIIVIVVTLNTQSIAMPDSMNLPLAYRILNAIDNSLFYILHYLWPVNLSPFYPYPTNASEMLDPSFWLPGAVFLTITISGSFYLLTKQVRAPFVLLGFYLVTLLPVSGLIHVGPAKATDHYVYLATLPLSLLTGMALVWVYDRIVKLRLVTLFIGVCYLGFLMAITIPQASYWNNHIALWGRVLTLYPESAFGHRNMAAAYAEVGAWQLALDHGEKSLEFGSPDQAYVERLREHVSNLK